PGPRPHERFITAYHEDGPGAAALDTTSPAVLPRSAPQTSVGQAGVRAYAGRAGQSVEESLRRLDYPPLTPEVAGTALVDLIQADAAAVARAYVLTGAGLQQLP